MLKNRIIPTLLLKNMGLVKDLSFKSERRVGSVLPQVKVYNMREVDELIILDVNGSLNQNIISINEVEQFSKFNFVPLTVGGGITSLDQISVLLSKGADKVCINSSAYINKKFVKSAVKQFGSQCIVGSVDYKVLDGKNICFSHSGQKNENLVLKDWITELIDLGIGELLLTSIFHDGKMDGFDFHTIKEISQIVDIPLIASGGASSYDDFLKCFQLGCDAVAAASIFHFTELTPHGAKIFLKENNVPVRF